MRHATAGLVVIMMIAGCVNADDEPASAYGAWANGPSSDPSFFPIAVWLQAPGNAAEFKAAGINTYIGLWKGPTEEQLTELKAEGMKVICDQNDVGLAHLDDDTIIAWMHGDEPDNAQSDGAGGWGPPVDPAKIEEDYERIAAADPSRPVVLNLGQGVAWDGWYGRGVRTNHPEDYAEYIKGCDIASFDIYPAVHSKPEVAGKLEFVAKGVQRLVEWTGGQKVVWNCIEASRISNTETKPTPEQIKAEVWMSLIHGSTGLIYFVHQFKPNFVEASLLQDYELLPAVTEINAQITELAPVLNSPSVEGLVSVETAGADVEIMVKQHDGAIYIFAVAMQDIDTKVEFRFEDIESGEAECLGKDQTREITEGSLHDEIYGYGVNLYKVTPN